MTGKIECFFSPGDNETGNMLQEILKSKGVRYVRAAYFFGDCAPYTCWDGFRSEVVDLYLERMKRDGFNCIILLIPEAISEIEFLNPDFSKFFWRALTIVMDKARAQGLYVLFRLNYIWDRFPIKLDRYRLTLEHHIPGEKNVDWLTFLRDCTDNRHNMTISCMHLSRGKTRRCI